MDTTIKALRDITSKADNKPPTGLLPKYPAKNVQVAPTALPYISNIRDIKPKEDFNRNNRLNISMEASAERPTYQLTDPHTNKSFDMDGTKGDGFSVLNGINYPRRAGFTKNLLLIHKDKTVFAGARLGEKVINDDDEERMLLKKLQETREKKEAIIKLMTANEKKQKEREAFQERITKIRNDSARKIQVRWRIYRDYKASRKQLELKRAEVINKIASKCESLLAQLNGRLIQENARLVKNVQIIQRNVRKFLAKKKLKILWRRKIAAFIQQKLCQTITKPQLKIGFNYLKSCGTAKVDNSTFFITTNPIIITMPTQDSDFDNACQLRSSNSRCSSKERNMSSPKSGNHSCARHHLHPKKSECIVSLNNTSITSLHNALEQKGEPSQVSKNRSSRFCTDGKSISNINETTNPDEEASAKKVLKGARLPPSKPLKSSQSLSIPDDHKKGLTAEKKIFKVTGL